MNRLTDFIKNDMAPALGVTEPGAIAYAGAKARKYAAGEIREIRVVLNSGVLKNAFECGIPGTDETGCAFAAALGVVGGDADLQLEALSRIDSHHIELARALISHDRVHVSMESISPRIYISVLVETDICTAQVVIQDSHTHIARILVDGEAVFLDAEETIAPARESTINAFTIKDFYDYSMGVPVEELSFLKQANEMNYSLFRESLTMKASKFAPHLYRENGGQIISDHSLATAKLLTCGALEARILGAAKPAMSVTGSGGHGIMCFMPLYAKSLSEHIPEERLLRSMALSALVTQYIKFYSGKLSAYCGCAIGGGLGMACGLVILDEGDYGAVKRTIYNIGSSITGMICTGGNAACITKMLAGINNAFEMEALAMRDSCISPNTGINGMTPEETIQNMGIIADPGMIRTEEVIMDLYARKQISSTCRI